MKKHIIVITTGGTIAMKEDPVTKKLIPAVSGKDLIDAIPEIGKYAKLDIIEFSNKPSGYMTIEDMFELSKKIDELAVNKNIDGFVITHGTDTLEETAFFLSVSLQTEKPVCVTGAMKGAAEVGYDGYGNILSSIRTAACDETYGKGVLVCFNEKIYNPEDVTKTHTTCNDTFKSPEWGPIGVVYSDEIYFSRTHKRRMKIHSDSIKKDVWIIKCYSGMDGKLCKLAKENNASGVVIEGLGCGNVPPLCKDGIIELRKAGIPVVLATRVHTGLIKEEYGYDGSAMSMKEFGIILSRNLSSVKARVLLALALGKTDDIEEIRKYFK